MNSSKIQSFAVADSEIVHNAVKRHVLRSREERDCSKRILPLQLNLMIKRQVIGQERILIPSILDCLQVEHDLQVK